MLLTTKEIESMSIHELRNTARNFGVKSPTSKKRQELIDEIELIKNGKLEPYKTNMGRPTKKSITSEIMNKIQMGTLVENLYNPLKVAEGRLGFEDGEKIDSINEYEIFDCYGVVRKLDDWFYIQNFVRGSKYILISSEQQKEYGIQVGDLIHCSAKSKDINFAYLLEVKLKNFDVGSKNNQNQRVIKVELIKTVSEMYEYIKKDNKINKIVLDIESNYINNSIQKNLIHLHSDECDDITISYNVMLDCKNLIKNLSAKEETFSLYIVNIEYIFSLLKVYYSTISKNDELNAGQYFKEILSMISNSKNGSVVLFEKENCKRSSYLDLIINKYC